MYSGYGLRAFMTTVYIALGILVGFILAGILPWALLRKLEREDEGREREDERRQER